MNDTLSPLPESVRGDISRVLIRREQIAEAVGRLAAEIFAACGARELAVAGVLTGSLIFLADLIRELPMRMRLDVVSVSSYGGAATRPGPMRFELPPAADLRGRDVLIVDDILDTGRTLAALRDLIGRMAPASLHSCVLLAKQRADLPDRIEADFVGFRIPDAFVVGYGLDYNGLYRNLPDVCVLHRPGAPR